MGLQLEGSLQGIMNKKAYITPTVEITEIETVAMLAASLVLNEEGGNESSLSNDRRGKWGDLWYVEED